MLLGSSISIKLSIFTGNFLPTYFLPIKADKESPSTVKINPDTVWSCFNITVQKHVKMKIMRQKRFQSILREINFLYSLQP